MSQTDVVIVGGGISGLTALHFLKQGNSDLTIKLFEADTRLGGTIGTDHIDGYSLDWGPNGFLDREPLTLQLADELGLKDELERANENVSNRFILRKGKLREVPMSPPKFMMSDIMSWPGKLRLITEPIAGKRKTDDESIYAFAKRRIGKEAADYLVQPMVSGVYGGVAERLSLKSCFPIMREMEDEYGSLFKAMIAKAKKARAEGKKSGGPAGPGGWLTSFEGGLSRIIERFEECYADHIVTGAEVTGLEQDNTGYRVIIAGAEAISASNVILAPPAYKAREITANLCEPLARALGEIDYAPISVVCLGYDEKQVRTNLDGFGFLVPRKENRRILGSIWTSSIFKDRAPDGKVQFRSMVGGDGDHESMKLTDAELVEQVRHDLDDILGIEGEPELVKLYRWSHGIPQFKVGHSKIMASIEAELRRLGNLYVTGNAYYGIGLNDCVKQSYKVAQAILAE